MTLKFSNYTSISLYIQFIFSQLIQKVIMGDLVEILMYHIHCVPSMYEAKNVEKLDHFAILAVNDPTVTPQ